MRDGVSASIHDACDSRKPSLEELIQRRGGIAHDLAVQAPCGGGDVGAPGMEAQGVRKESHALLVRTKQVLQLAGKLLLVQIRYEGRRWAA